MSMSNHEARLERAYARLTDDERVWVETFLAAEAGMEPGQRGTLSDAKMEADMKSYRRMVDYINIYFED